MKDPSMSFPKQNLLRNIPAVETLLQDAQLHQMVEQFPRSTVVDAVRRAVAHVRDMILSESDVGETLDESQLRQQIIARAHDEVHLAMRPQYRKVINATGIILHTGLGRAVLSEKVIEHLATDLSGYSLLQIDIASGRRGRRDERIERILQQLTGAEAATVVNNNAAATSIVLNTVAKGKEVIVSRGQLVEIGGSFRLPDVMAASGAKLVEVGTTNKTHPRDYEDAITENTAAILRVHPSNYKILGFTSEVPAETLVEIAHAHDLVMIDDVGAGALIDTSKFGFETESMLSQSVSAGADLITCSGDKLIGASQAGLILGRAEWVGAVRKNPFARIVRPGKLTLAALETTLSLFLDEPTAMREVPTLRMMARKLGEIASAAERIVDGVRRQTEAADCYADEGFSQMGSGSLPAQNLPTRLVVVKPKNCSVESLARRLRAYKTPIFARVKDDRVLLDPRTLLYDEETILVKALVDVLEAGD